MKIEKQNKEFVPVIIRLETKEELEDMKHLFERNTNVSLHEYCDAKDINGKKRQRLLKLDADINGLLSCM